MKDVERNLEIIVGDNLFGRPHQSEHFTFEFEGKTYLIAEKNLSDPDAVYSKDGLANLFGTEHYQIDGVIKTKDKTLLKVKLSSKGPESLVSSDGKMDWFGCPHQKLFEIITVSGKEFLLAIPSGEDLERFYDITGEPVDLFGGPHESVLDMFKMGDEPFIVATKDDRDAVYSSDGKNNWFGGPHYHIFTQLKEIDGKKFIKAQKEKDGPVAIYSSDGQLHWFNGPFGRISGGIVFVDGQPLLKASQSTSGNCLLYTLEGRPSGLFGGLEKYFNWQFLDFNNLDFIVAKFEKNGKEYLVSKECKINLFGGPHEKILGLRDVDNQNYLEVIRTENKAINYLISSDGLGFTSKEDILCSNLASEKNYSDTYKRILSWFREFSSDIGFISKEIADLIEQTNLLDHSRRLFNLTGEELLNELAKSPEDFILDESDNKEGFKKVEGYEDLIMFNRVDLFKDWLNLVIEYSDNKTESLSLKESILAIQRIHSQESHERFDDCLSYNLKLLRRNRNSLAEITECSKLSFNNYNILKKLGQGAFKKVYLAEAKVSPGHFVALKQIDPTAYWTDRILEHYDSVDDWVGAELSINHLAKLNSDFVAKPETPFKGEDGIFYYVEQAFKETLKDKVSREGKCDLSEGLKIALQIVTGLSDCHNYKKPIIHKDLKPDNIGLDENGTVKLTDFGSLDSLSHDLSDRDLSNINYSPEKVLRGEKNDEKTNIYSVG
ncbi:protein kinase, partial [Candidatus Woesearchaeota archaeon]|nr:protein kinase [Candidatus Woesearchaeota archaeon]